MASAARRDGGESLIELLLAIAIMGIAFTAVLAGLATSVRGSGIHRTITEAGGYARDAIENVSNPVANPWNPCASTYSVGSAVPAGYTAAVRVDYWNGTTFVSSVPAGCLTSVQLQRVTVTVTANNGQDTETLQATRRKP